jgi:hypothetical protein
MRTLTRLLIILASLSTALGQAWSWRDPAFMASLRQAGASNSTLLTGLVAYWKMDEASGSRLDSTANHLDLAVGGSGISSVAGIIGNCVSLPNLAYLSEASSASLQLGSSSFTIGVWAQLSAVLATQVIVSKNDGSTVAGSEYWLGFVAGDNLFEFVVYSGSSTSYTVKASTFGTPAIDTWYYIVATYNSSAQTISISVNNGAANVTSSVTGAINATSTEFDVGTNAAHTAIIKGFVDELACWSRILTGTETTRLYNSGAGVTYPGF